MSDTPEQIKERLRQEAEREQQRKRLREEKAIQDVFDSSSVKFKQSPEQVLRGITGKVTFDADGVPMANGKSLAEMLTEYAKINPVTVASTLAEVHDGGKSTIRSKSDFKNDREKVDYINEFGDQAFARLPTTRQEPINEETMTFQQYTRLSPAQKVALVDKYGPGFSARLKAKESEQIAAQRLAGVPLEKINKR